MVVNKSPSLTYGSGLFSNRLFSAIASQAGEAGGRERNILFSPHSIKMALLVLKEGASGDTYEEINEFLYKKITLETSLNEAELRWRRKRGVTLDIANAVMVDPDIRLKREYSHDVRKELGAFIGRLGVKGVSQANQWAKKKTHGMIEDIVKEGDIDASTLFAFFNAAYFNAPWACRFNKESAPGKFRRVDGTADILMMTNEAPYRYYATDKYEMIRLPYVTNSDTSMVILLPAGDPMGAKDFAQEFIKGGLLAAGLKELEESEPAAVSITMPRFSIDWSADLKTVLMEMGLKKMFSPDEADFSDMVIGGSRVFVNMFRHSASITVDERGSEASAVAAALPSLSFCPPMLVNRPFYYGIESAGIPIMSGFMACPPMLMR